MKIVQTNDVKAWYSAAKSLSAFTRSIGAHKPDPAYLELALGMPYHLRFAIEKLAETDDYEGGEIPADAFDSLPFYSLCKGLFLPLSYLSGEMVARLFGLRVGDALDAKAREALLIEFVQKDVGLTLTEKLGCVLGDPFLGRRSTFRRDSLLRLLMSMAMVSRSSMLDRLTRVGDVAVLFAESRPTLKSDEPLTSAEVLRALRFIPDVPKRRQFEILRSILERCGKLEAFFVAKLMLRKAGFGFDYQGPLLARVLAEQFGADEDLVNHAIALTDVFNVTRVLNDEGVDGLKSIRLQPLVPFRPALASGTTDEIEQYPVWVERKYDGIRILGHKSTDAHGSTLCGAYTRTRGDWLELIPGLDASLKTLPAQNAILDGELFGTTLDIESGSRPATVYEVFATIQGEAATPVNLKYAAFDLLYLNGQDMTGLPLSQRRQRLQMLVAPLAQMPLPVPVVMSEGQMAANKDDVNRLYNHFRAQGYEGVITKDIHSPYRIATRDPAWLKRKPTITLDLVLLGGTLAVTTKQAHMFGSYVIGARNADGGFDDVGDVAGVDRQRDTQIQQLIMSNGLLTGQRFERPSSSGVRPGVGLAPHIVVTVKFEGITRDQATGELKLRDPKLAMIRSDKSASEADSVEGIREIYLRQRVG